MARSDQEPGGVNFCPGFSTDQCNSGQVRSARTQFSHLESKAKGDEVKTALDQFHHRLVQTGPVLITECQNFLVRTVSQNCKARFWSMRRRGNFDALLPEPECLPSTKPKIKTRLELESQNFFRCEGYIMQKDPVLNPFFIPYHKWPGLKSFHSKSVLPGLPHTNPSVSNSEKLGPAPNQRERFESCLLSACCGPCSRAFSFCATVLASIQGSEPLLGKRSF